MKRTITRIFTAFCLAFIFTSCESTKVENSEKETTAYEDVVETVNTESETTTESDSEADTYEASEEEAINEYHENDIDYTAAKKEKKALFSFGNTDKFILTDTFSIFTPNALSQYKQKSATITIDPKEKVLGFGSAYMLAYYIILFDEEGMEKFQTALNNYLRDFENKKLERKNKKTLKKYGSVDGKIWWGTIKTSTPNNATPRYNFGYEFYERSPYFTISISPALNQYFATINSDADKENMYLKYYFTKAQAKELAKYLTPEYSNALISEYNLELTGGAIQEADSY